jgi:hypothetical protein
MRNEIEFNWFLIGAKLADASDDEQALFFNGFANELNSWDTHSQKEMQMLLAGDKMNKKAKEVIEKYLPALWFNDK